MCFARICMCVLCIAGLVITIGFLLGFGPFKHGHIIHVGKNFIDVNCDPHAPGSPCRPRRPFLAPLPGPASAPSPSWFNNLAPSPSSFHTRASAPAPSASWFNNLGLVPSWFNNVAPSPSSFRSRADATAPAPLRSRFNNLAPSPNTAPSPFYNIAPSPF